MEGGHTFWSTTPSDSCQFNRYDLLYNGEAHKVINEDEPGAPPVFTVAGDEHTFALTQKGIRMVCNRGFIRTDHPKLFILDGPDDELFAHKTILPLNLDNIVYTNAKFVYVEQHIKTQITKLYYDMLVQKCELELQVLRQSLTLAVMAPDEFAFQLMKGPGYMAVAAGEVVHILKCIPTEVSFRRTEECFHQLPVFRGNHSAFLAPRTHVLLQSASQVTCNPVIPTMYSLDDAWYKIIPAAVQSLTPPNLKPLTKAIWKYENPGSLATSGIYTTADLKNMREHVMFPIERPGLLHSLARSISGHPTNQQGINMMHLLDEETLQRISENAWGKIWTSFLTFGTASAGLIGLFFVFRGIKLMIDTIIHGYALHTLYGWSIVLIGAIWDSVTHLLIHLANQGKQQGDPSEVVDHASELRENPETLENLEEGERTKEISSSRTD